MDKILFLELPMANASFWLLVGAFMHYCSGALFTAAAHQPYNLTNFFMANKITIKFKVYLKFIDYLKLFNLNY